MVQEIAFKRRFAMRRRTKLVWFLCTLLVTVLGFNSIVWANDVVLEIETAETAGVLNGVGRIVSGGEITIDGVKNSLYRVFENQEKAINDIKSKTTRLLEILSKDYNLSSLSESNWKEYEEAMYLYLDSVNETGKEDGFGEEIRVLRSFFDIYENVEKNDYILQLTKDNSSNEKEKKDLLALALPCTEPLACDFMEQHMMVQSRAPIDVQAAINYATTYATNRNTASYYSFSHGDCTNFLSQILENAGVSQVVYNSEYSGWWHTVTTSFFGLITNHHHSRSWTMADVFARYMGVTFTTYSNRTFSENIEAGSIIGADFQDDGDWDHMGFVTARDNYVGSYGYYDYKVAQHTTDYHSWASFSDNNWELIGADGGKYARVRN